MGNYVPVRCRHFSLMNRKDMSKCAGLYYLNADLLADDRGLCFVAYGLAGLHFWGNVKHSQLNVDVFFRTNIVPGGNL